MNAPSRASRSTRLLTLGLCLSIAVESNVPRSAHAQAPAAPANVSTGCEATAIAEALRDLFPPAPSDRRKHAATVLDECHVPGVEGVLAAALPLAEDDASGAAIATTLSKFRTPVAGQAMRQAMHRSSLPTVRATAMRALADAGAAGDLVGIINDVRESDDARAAALQTLFDTNKVPTKTYLDWVKRNAGPRLAAVAKRKDLVASTPTTEQTSEPTPEPATPNVVEPQPIPLPSVPAAEAPVVAANPTKATGPMDGRPLTLGASTVAGATFFLNLSLLGIQDVRAQVLLGSAGGIIGFGTSWALSRFGVRPSVEQAAWFANATAWGTLAGAAIYGGSGSTNYKLKYGSLVFGEMAGMAVGVWGAHRWTWTGEQIAMADSLVVGAGLVGFGFRRAQGRTSEITPAVSIGIVPTMVAAAIAGHALDPSRNDLVLSTSLAVGGAWTGALLGSGAASADLFDSYAGQGGLTLGLGLGYLGGAALGAFSEVAPTRVRTMGFGLLAGNLAGLGTHMMITGLRRDSAGLMAGDSARWKLGAGLGGLAVGGLAFAAEPYLHPGPSAAAMTLWGAAYGAGIYGLALSAAYDGRVLTDANTAVLQGGLLALGVTSGVTGLLLSSGFNPDEVDQMTAFGATAAGLTTGLGASLLLTDHAGTKDGVGLALGAALGLSAGAAYAHSSRLTPPMFTGAMFGAAYGAFAGTLLPSIADETWQGGRKGEGGALLGLGLGAGMGAAIAQLTHASASEVAAPGFASVLGLGAGTGVGMLWNNDGGGSRVLRIGALTGSAAFLAGASIFERPLRLAEPRPEGTARLVFATSAIGIADGLWLAALSDGVSSPSDAKDRRVVGGLLFGGSIGLASGLVLAPFLQPRINGNQVAMMATATATGTAMGRGIAMLSSSTPGAGDSLGTLVGSIAGTVGGSVAAAYTELGEQDTMPVLLGATSGALWGALAPSITDLNWPGAGRKTSAGLWLGASSGAVLGMAAGRWSEATRGDVGLTALAGADGLMTGLGVGMLLHQQPASAQTPDTDRHLRVGMLVGSVAGMGFGMASWTHQTLGPGDRELVASSVVVAGWTGALLPLLGHASSDNFSSTRSVGGAMAGAGTASFVAGMLTPHLEVDTDVITNAMVLDSLFTGAGLGAGLLVSERDDAPLWGMLGVGTLGLGLGAALHRQIESTEAAKPIMTLGALEGLWLGAMIPYALRNPEDITQRQHMGGALLGGFGGLGASVLASTVFQPSTEGAAFAGVSSALGASMAGGIALISTQIENQNAARLTLAGSAAGLVTGGLLSRSLQLRADSASYGLLGGALGAAEGLTFAWSARSEGTDPFVGSALFGAGLGATMGLATAASMQDSKTQTPVLAGFAAWGGWIGSFSGSLFARDAHEITAGGLLGSNAALLAGYGLTKSGLVEQGDFGWLSLFAAGGTAVGALAGAPFASRGEPRPILAGLAIGPAVGIAVGTFVAPRLRHLDNNASVSLNDTPSSRGGGSWFRMPRFARSRSETSPADDSSHDSASASNSTASDSDEAPRDGDLLPASRPGSSPQIAQDIDIDHRTRRSVGRAVAASIGIEDCTPMIGALPSSPDSPPTGTTPPMIFGLTGRWR